MNFLSLPPTILSPTEPPAGGVLIDQKRWHEDGIAWSKKAYICRRTIDENGKEKCEVKGGWDHRIPYNPDTDGLYYFKQKVDCKAACKCHDWIIIDPRSSSQSSSRDSSQGTRENQITADIAYLERISNISESGTNGKVMALAQRNIRSNAGVGLEYQLTRTLQTDPGIAMAIGVEHGGTVDNVLDLGDAINSGMSTSDNTGYTLFHAFAEISADFKATAMCKTVSPCLPFFPDFVFEDTGPSVSMYANEHQANNEIKIYISYNAISVKCCGEASLKPGVLASKTWGLPTSRVDLTFYIDGIINPDSEFNSQKSTVALAVGSYIMENISGQNGEFQNTLLMDLHKLPGAWLDSKDCTMCSEPGEGAVITTT